jgi:hypothetical protein
MTNEDMMRPCTWGGKLFDAYQNLNIIEGGIDSSLTYYKTLSYSDVKIIDNDGYLIVSKKCASAEKEDVLKVKMEAITTISDALNAPVLATEEVLAGLPKDAKVYTIDEKTGDALKCTFDEQWGWVCGTGHFNEALELGRPYRIFTINDPKTEDYLRQFTLEGVRKETKDV